jgi:general secretion pathway protein I
LCSAARSESGTAGFTLIEVLVALALVAVSLAAIGRVVAVTSHGVPRLEQRVAAVETLRNLLAGLSPRSRLAAGSLSGEAFGQRWRIDTRPWQGAGLAPRPNSPWAPQAVTIEVREPSGAVMNVETVRLLSRGKE